MASLLLSTFLVLACACVVLGAPKKDSFGGSSKKATSTTTTTTVPPKPKCEEKCPEEKAPICAKEEGSTDKPKQTFANTCLLNKYNCENGTNLVKESDGECKGDRGASFA